MTPEEFDRAAAETRLKPDTLEMLRTVLIDGVYDSEAARQYGVTRARVYNAKMRLLKAHKKINGFPSDWVTMHITVPPKMAKKIEEEIAKLKI